MSHYEHMDLVMDAYEGCGLEHNWMALCVGEADALSFGDAWALGEQVIAMAWGYAERPCRCG